jgi:hypothetical protein
MKSPLLIGADMQTIAAPFLELMKNKELIAVNQDAAGIQGTLRAASAYADGDTRGGEPSQAAAAILAAAMDTVSVPRHPPWQPSLQEYTLCVYL